MHTFPILILSFVFCLSSLCTKRSISPQQE